ncbi:C901 [Strongyloides ratti]|uniref:Delta-like protein n=1 Tax=Strongyloides ratti TaxID=34506 RepID=A0A090L7A1_STRRB|nr:C901 [Strongyloides ratti]CEF64008.1 C901 [Strongyloides ratti]
MNIIIILLFFFINIFSYISSKGVLEVKLISFISKSISPIEINVCIKEYQTIVEDTGDCRFGTKSIILPKGYYIPEANSNISHVLIFPFDMTWPKSHSLIVKGKLLNNDEVKVNDSVVIIYKQSFLHSGNLFLDVGKAENTNASIHFFSSIKCDVNYYGTDCSKICYSNVFENEHVECDQNGKPICKEGWSGIKCDQPICKFGCGLNGKCVAPDTCDCLSGYTGKSCEECLPSVGCQNGYCKNKGNECICNEGWAGEFCEIDIEPCHKKNKCKNNGVCLNGKDGSVRCECKGRFYGKYCQHEKISCSSFPCQNGGTCVMTSDGSEFKPVCDCLPSFFGKYCQSTKDTNDYVEDIIVETNEIIDKKGVINEIELEEVKIKKNITSYIQWNFINIIVVLSLLIVIAFLIATRKKKITRNPTFSIVGKYHTEELNPSRLEKASKYPLSSNYINYTMENVYSYEPFSSILEKSRNFENVISEPQIENGIKHFKCEKNNEYDDLYSEVYSTISDRMGSKTQL